LCAGRGGGFIRYLYSVSHPSEAIGGGVEMWGIHFHERASTSGCFCPGCSLYSEDFSFSVSSYFVSCRCHWCSTILKGKGLSGEYGWKIADPTVTARTVCSKGDKKCHC